MTDSVHNDIDSIWSEFEHDLLHEQGLKQATVDKHLYQLLFFADIYLTSNDIHPTEFNADMIIDFLGDYYIRKVLNSSKSDIAPFLTAFKKYAAFLLSKGSLSAAEYDRVRHVCRSKDYFIHRFDQYMSDDHDLLQWSIHNDFEAYEKNKRSEMNAIMEQKESIIIDETLSRRWADKKLSIPPVLNTFQSFLHAVKQSRKVAVTSVRQHIQRQFWLEFDQSSGLGLFEKKSMNQHHIPLYQFFFHFALHYKLIVLDGRYLKPTPLLDAFLQLADTEQISALLDGLWNGIPWRNLQSPDMGGRPEITHSNRNHIAQCLSNFPVGEEIALTLENPLGHHLLYNILFNGTMDVFLITIVPVLEQFHLLEATYQEEEGHIAYKYENFVAGLTLTREGLAIFNVLKQQVIKKKSDLSEFENTLATLHTSSRPVVKGEKVGRNEPCPCGSGKKYKRCCL